jgi:hypothetical protein
MPGLQFQAGLSPPAADMPVVGIIKVGFNLIICREPIKIRILTRGDRIQAFLFNFQMSRYHKIDRFV